MKRLFVAIDFPEAIKEKLEQMTWGIPGAKSLNASQMHLTLRFIGEVDGTKFREIRELLGRIKVAPFDITLKGVGHFGSNRFPRVLWMGVEKNESLNYLRNKIENLLIQYGLEPEGRKFSPHITLARLGHVESSDIVDFLQSYSLLKSPPITINEFYLFSSHLLPKGAEYHVEESYMLFDQRIAQPMPRCL